MIFYYATPSAAEPARTLRRTLLKAYPELDIEDLDPAGRNLTADPLWPRWDDLLIVVFADDALPDALHETIRKEIEAATDQQRGCRILPVHTYADRARPPAPLDAVKSMRGVDPEGADGGLIAQRIGALLSLWLRGEGRRIFVSHRQSDGAGVAAEVTAHLRASGYDAWLDKEQLRGGDLVQPKIEAHVAGAHLLLLLDTPQADSSEWIWREVDAALAGFVPVLPVVLRPREASGRAAGPGFPNASELFTHRIDDVELDAARVVQPLGGARLDALLLAMEAHLSSILRAQLALADNAKATFLAAGFDWTPLDERRQLYSSGKADGGVALVRLLSHCSAVSPRLFHAVRALQDYRCDERGRPADANLFNHRLFIYDPPLPRPVLERLYRDHGFDQVLLRLIDPSRLATFLSRYQTDV